MDGPYLDSVLNKGKNKNKTQKQMLGNNRGNDNYLLILMSYC